MNRVEFEQIQSIKVAEARLKAEKDVAKAMLSDDIRSECHYNGKTEAMKRYPEQRELIEVAF